MDLKEKDCLTEGTALLDETEKTEPKMVKTCWNCDKNLLVDVLSGLFGMSSWLCINGLFTQLPLLVQIAPEGWNLPSYLSVIIQLANIGPILYSLTHRFPLRIIRDSTLIMLILLLGTAAMLLMSIFYSSTTLVFGNKHSMAMFIIAFCLALVGCTSSVLFIPFMNNYPEIHLVSYLVGEGLSGLIPSIVSLIQGVGGNPQCVTTTSPDGITVIEHVTLPPLFSSSLFFLILFILMSGSSVAFVLLNKLPTCRIVKIQKKAVSRSSTMENANENGVRFDNEVMDPSQYQLSNASTLTPTLYIGLLLLQAVISMFANGALPSIQSYSCLPYGNTAYHLAVNLANMANPIACFIAFFLPHTSLVSITTMSAFSVITTVYAITTSLMSPNPPLQNSVMGIVIVVSCWVLFCGMVSYIKLSIASLFRREGGRGLFWYGAVTQTGAAVGSITMFYLVNFTQLFKTYDPCR